MTPSWQAVTVGIALFVTIAAYALFVGADFGGGIWDLLAGGDRRGARPRAAIDRSVTPVWEGNQVWIVLGIVFLWTGFPAAFRAIMIALFVPLSVALLGLVLRGVGFAFRHEAERPSTKRLTGALFAASSLLAPFFLGTAVGAVATHQVPAHPHGNITRAWTSATALVTGGMFVAACAFIGGVFLVGDSHRRGDDEMTHYFTWRALAGGATTGVLAGVNMWLMHSSAPYLFSRLTGVALPLVCLSAVAGILTFAVLLRRNQWLLRITGGLAVASVVAAWGWAQYPYLLPRSLTIQAGSAPTASLNAEIAVAALALLLVVPAFTYLYYLQQTGRLEKDSASLSLRLAASAAQQPVTTAAADRKAGHPLLAGAVLAAAAVQSRRRQKRRRPR